ncbi:Ricin-type beta-trefoil lectin domain-containing protein [Micromonospora echinospora]|uniref:Ricin-type beta-trefoil lectin domain-containing protein n=1 Tax=Micromonospora echinospora TaxID=1877 RepID=A0A1C4W5U1_MICEC|nr:RICIN domain-containing protein [Micromonospora echinospora]SCE91401.1 Ricin-type beta-trefoil lectin domain-containing protein [Micromonospora echinospora]
MRQARRYGHLAGVLAAAMTVAVGLAVAPTAPAAAIPGGTAAAPPLQCVDNGTSGHRVQVLYAYEPGSSRFAEREPAIRAAAWVAQQNVNDSAKRDGAQRWIRFLTGSTGCHLTIDQVQVPAGTDAADNLVPHLRSLGYDADDRNYLILFENHRVNCAGASSEPITSPSAPGTGNQRNSVTSWVAFQPSCFTGHTFTHELTHALGGVQADAPHFDGGGHCTDGNETLCQSDSPTVCTDPLAVRLLDCGRDDYFAVSPQGSYLPTHWNAATDSRYLQAGTSVSPMTTIPALPPQVLRATDVEGTSLVLSYLPSMKPVGSGHTVDHQVLRNGTVVATVPGWRTSVRLTGLATNTTATYTVRQRVTHGGVTRTSVDSQPLSVTTNSSTAAAGAAENGATMIFANDVVDGSGTNLALDVLGFSEAENATVIQWPQNGEANQQWKMTSATGGTYTLTNNHSLKCLTPLGGATTVGTPVVQASCSGAAAQRWTFTALTGLTYHIKASSGLCVQAAGASTGALVALELATCSTTEPTQRWTTNRTA